MSAERLTGLWQLDHKLCDSQEKLLTNMGRVYWQRKVIDFADEKFFLLHFQRGDLHYFLKRVDIYLAGKTFAKWTKILKLEFDKVHYAHTIKANCKEVEHKDDEKRFGDCTSVTSWGVSLPGVPADAGFTIRWRLQKGVLKVQHIVTNDDILECHMTFTKPDGSSTQAVKRYRRLPFEATDKEYIASHKQRPHLRVEAHHL